MNSNRYKEQSSPNTYQNPKKIVKDENIFKITSNSKYVGLKNKINDIVSQNKENEKRVFGNCLNSNNYTKRETNTIGNSSLYNCIKGNKKISFNFN